VLEAVTSIGVRVGVPPGRDVVTGGGDERAESKLLAG
jgi:hypothetical protein